MSLRQFYHVSQKRAQTQHKRQWKWENNQFQSLKWMSQTSEFSHFTYLYPMLAREGKVMFIRSACGFLPISITQNTAIQHFLQLLFVGLYIEWSKSVLLKLWHIHKSPSDLVKMQVLIQYVWGGAWQCISNKLLGHTEAAGSWIIPWVARINTNCTKELWKTSSVYPLNQWLYHSPRVWLSPWKGKWALEQAPGLETTHVNHS